MAISEIEKLPLNEQNEFAAWILEELHAEEHWAKQFTQSDDLLSHLADEALAKHKAKNTRKLDPDRL